jgi:HEAT repeat protein
MTSRIHLVLGLAATMLEVVAIIYFIRWFSETDWLMGHTKGAPTDIFTAFAAAAIGMIATVVWFALAVYLKLAPSGSNTSLANHHGFRRLQGVTLALLVIPSGLILMVAGSEIPMAIEMQKTERLERTAHEPRGTSTVTELVDVLNNDRSSYRRGLAVEALERMGPKAKDAVPSLIEALDEPGIFGRFTVPMALSHIGSTAVPEIKRAMNEHGSARVRSGCAKALGFMGLSASEAVPALQMALHDSDSDVRMAASESLGRIGHKNASDRIPMLEETASGSDISLKGQAIRELGRIGPSAKSANAILHAALDDPEPGIRLDAANSLWRTDRDAEHVVPVLAALLEVPTEYRYRVNVPATAAYYLGKMGRAAEAAVPELTGALQHPKESVRTRVAEALGHIGPAAEPAVPDLLDMIKASSPSSTKEIGIALQALTRIDPEAAIAIIQTQPGAFKALKQQDYTSANMQYEAYLDSLRRKPAKD